MRFQGPPAEEIEKKSKTMILEDFVQKNTCFSSNFLWENVVFFAKKKVILSNFLRENTTFFVGKHIAKRFEKNHKNSIKISETDRRILAEFPEISAAWRAAFSARNRRKVGGRVGPGSARKTR